MNRECRTRDSQFLEGEEEDLVVHCSKAAQRSSKIMTKDRGDCSSSVKFLCDGKEGSLCTVACLESRLVRVVEVFLLEICRKLSKDSTLKCSGKNW